MPEAASRVPWYALTPEAVLRELGSNLQVGLSKDEVKIRRTKYGPNVLPEPSPPSPLVLFVRQFTSLIVWVLIGAAVVSGLLQEWIDAAAILAIVLLNAVLGFVQEFRAERSLAALRKLSVTTARVVRAGDFLTIPARELVPGDVIQVEAGDHVPADARLVYATRLQTQEAALTGESTPVDKTDAALPDVSLVLADQCNLLFLGTDVTAGKGQAVVVATGKTTELGRIAELIGQAGVDETPLQRRLDQLGHVLLIFSLGIVAVVFFLGLFRGEPFGQMFLTAVSLAVAAIPEGLPAIVTVTLALGVTRMVKRNALIRRLPAVETLGATTVICTDKTGTLTKNEMTVSQFFVGGHRFAVSGEGYAPVGEIRQEGEALTSALPAGVRELLIASVLCNSAVLQEKHGTWQVLGDPTEGALLVAAAKARLFKDQLQMEHPFISEIPFDSERKMMTIVRQTVNGPVAYVKGAPDVLLRYCTQEMTLTGSIVPFDDAARQRIVTVNQTFAHDALRVLGVAYRPLRQAPAVLRAEEVECGLIFLGLMAMKDPLRPEAKTAVITCREAGIGTVMITGDHKDTAVAIARELGIMNGSTRALSGAELGHLSDAALVEGVGATTVYARVSAEHKLRVVKAWKARGAVVAMTGDGVNDAPALKEADIGVAMGLTGTDVTKEAADMVVTDDNFASIAAAVEEGRGIYNNIRKAVHYLLSCNLSEIFLMLVATVLFLPLPLLPVQILWINLVSDGLPALALAVDPNEPDLMRQPPRSPTESFLTARRVTFLSVQGVFIALTALFAFVVCLSDTNSDVSQARTVAFTILVVAQLFHALNCRSDTYSVFQLGLFTNPQLLWALSGSVLLQAGIVLSPWTREIFQLTPLSTPQWFLAFGLGILPLIAMEAWKAVRRHRKETQPRENR
jgi:Ca2+-transporting ATPase